MIESTAADMGFQVTAANFASIGKYGNEQIYDYLLDLNEKDPFVKTGVEDEELDYVKGGATIKDEEIVSDAKDAAIAELVKVRKTFKEDTSVADKVKALDEAVKAQLPKIDEAYKKALEKAKEEANDMLVSLSESITSNNYSDADRENDLKAAQDAVEAAGSLKEINAVVQTSNILDPEDETTIIFEKGSAYSLLTTKKSVLATLESTLESVLDKQPDLDPENDGHEALVAALKTWGVSVDSFPAAVAEEYLTKVSSATSFEVYTEDAADGSYKKGQVKLEVEGTKAISETLSNLKKATIAAVKNSYFAEIDGSTVLADAPSAKTTLKAVIESIIVDFNSNATDLNALVSTAEGGMIYTIERVITDGHYGNYVIPGTVIVPFNKERVLNASKDASKVLTAKVSEMLTADPAYASAISCTKIEEGKYKVTGKLGVEGYTVDNPFYSAVTQGTDPDKNWYSTSEITKEYSINKYYDSLFKDGALLAPTAGDKTVAGDTAILTVLEAKQTVEGYLKGFKPVYDAAKDKYQSKQKSVRGVDELSKEWDELFRNPESATGDKATQEQFDSYVFEDVSNAAKSFVTSADLLFADDGAHTKYERAFKDYEIKGTGINSINSSIDDKYNTLKTKVLTGKGDAKDVEEFTKSIAKYYASDVAAYKQKTVELFNGTVTNIITNSENAVQVEDRDIILARQAKAIATLDENKWYDNSSYAAIGQWLTDAVAWVQPGADNVDPKDPSVGATSGCLGLSDLKAESIQGYRKAVIARMKQMQLGAQGHNVTTLFNALIEQLPSETETSMEWVFVKKEAETFKAMFDNIKLPSGLKLKDESTTADPAINGLRYTITWDLTTASNIDEWFKDLETVYKYLGNKAVELSKVEDKATESLKALLLKYVGNDFKAVASKTEVGVDQIETELTNTLKSYFGTTAKAEVTPTTSTNAAETQTIGKIDVYSADNNIVMSVKLNDDEEIEWTKDTPFALENGLTFVSATETLNVGLLVVDLDTDAYYNMLTSTGLNGIASAFDTSLKAIDGKLDA